MRSALKDLVARIVSGGQTGADRAALDWAIHNNIPHGGWCPRGRKAEDGPLDVRYKLMETSSEDYLRRTRQNIVDSDGTIILNLGRFDGGTLATEKLALRLNKPHLVLQLDVGDEVVQVRTLLEWLDREAIATLNVAGPRESKRPSMYLTTYDFLNRVVDFAQYMLPEEKIQVSPADQPPDCGTFTPPQKYQVTKRKPRKKAS